MLNATHSTAVIHRCERTGCPSGFPGYRAEDREAIDRGFRWAHSTEGSHDA